MITQRQIISSILLGVMLALLVALTVTYLWPPPPAPLSVWNWDQWQRFAQWKAQP